MRSNRKKVLFPLLFFLLVPAAGTIAVAGGVAYPALGNFRSGEGTIEVWLTPKTALRPDLEPGEFSTAFHLFSLDVPDGFRMVCTWASKRGEAEHRETVSGLGVNLGNYIGPERGLINLTLTDNAPEWSEDTPIHLAFVWSGPDMRLYSNGRLVSEREQIMGFSGDLAGTEIFFGHPRGRDNPILLHAVRISSVARELEEIANAEPVADAVTLLLDRFDEAGSLGDDGRTSPEVISSPEASNGFLHGRAHWVESPRPGILLQQKPE